MEDIFKKFRLDGRVAIVTGGLGQLGSEFVKTLKDAGAKVIIFDNKLSNPKLREMNVFTVDISKKESIKKALSEVIKDYGVPEVLVNCAAIDIPPNYLENIRGGLLEDEKMEEIYDRIIEVNIKGTLLCSQIIGEKMREIKRGSIINISSIYGEISPDQRIYEKRNNKEKFVKPIAYCISKASIPNLTRYLATYFAKENVRVNTLTFGGVFNNQDPEFVRNYSSKVPLGRMANKDEYNGAVLFLASDASLYMTGSNIIIDGGYTSW